MNRIIVEDDVLFSRKLKNDIPSFLEEKNYTLSIEVKTENFIHITSDKPDIAFIDIDLNNEDGIILV